MLIILPPSETQSEPPTTGIVLDLDRLSFRELTPTRQRMIKALIATSREPDALRRLVTRPRQIGDVMRNTRLWSTPTKPAWQLFHGPLYKGLAPDGLSVAAVKRAAHTLVITSSLFGAVRPADLIPAYRLSIHSHLIGIDRIDATWRGVLPGVLSDAPGPRGLVLDLRSGPYRAVGSPVGAANRTVVLRVLPGPAKLHIGDVDAKRIRGEVVHQLLESATDPPGPDELADILGQWWPVRVDPPQRGEPWTIRLRESD